MEMIMVLLIIFIILSLALVVYFKFFLVSIREKGQQLSMQEADVLLASITSMPELQCSFRSQDELCLDIIKLESFKNLLNQESNALYYDRILGGKNIRVEQVYPEGCDICKWDIYSTSRDNAEKFTISTPVPLFFPGAREYRIGRLTIEVLQ